MNLKVYYPNNQTRIQVKLKYFGYRKYLKQNYILKYINNFKFYIYYIFNNMKISKITKHVQILKYIYFSLSKYLNWTIFM